MCARMAFAMGAGIFVWMQYGPQNAAPFPTTNTNRRSNGEPWAMRAAERSRRAATSKQHPPSES